MSRRDVEVVSVVGPGGIATDPGRVARQVASMPLVDGSDPDDWIESWRRTDADLGERLDALVASDQDALPLRVAAVVAAAVPARGAATVVVGSSPAPSSRTWT